MRTVRYALTAWPYEPLPSTRICCRPFEDPLMWHVARGGAGSGGALSRPLGIYIFVYDGFDSTSGARLPLAVAVTHAACASSPSVRFEQRIP